MFTYEAPDGRRDGKGHRTFIVQCVNLPPSNPT